MEYHGRIGSYWPQYQEGEIKNKGLNSRKHRCLSLRFVFAVAISSPGKAEGEEAHTQRKNISRL